MSSVNAVICNFLQARDVEIGNSDMETKYIKGEIPSHTLYISLQHWEISPMLVLCKIYIVESRD